MRSSRGARGAEHAAAIEITLSRLFLREYWRRSKAGDGSECFAGGRARPMRRFAAATQVGMCDRGELRRTDTVGQTRPPFLPFSSSHASSSLLSHALG